LAAIKAVWEKITHMGIDVLGVMAHTLDATDFIWKIEPPFQMLVDQEQKTIHKYGLGEPKFGGVYMISRPATFVIDKNGVVQYSYVGDSRSDRPDITALLKTLHEVSGH
jgi:peroxiredoxin